MATDIGTVYVNVLPDGSQWDRRVKQIVANTPDINIGLDVDTRRVVEKVQQALDKTYEVAVDARFSAEQIARALAEKARGLSVSVNASISSQSLALISKTLQGVAQGIGSVIGSNLARKFVPDNQTVRIKADVDDALARLQIARLTRKRTIELKMDADTGVFALAAGGLGAITEAGEAAAETASAVAGGLEAASTVAEGAANIFQTITNAFKTLGSLAGSVAKALGSFVEGVAAVGAAAVEAVATGGLTIVLAALVVVVLAATAAISGMVIVMLAAAAAAGAFTLAALAAGAASAALAAVIGALVAALGLLPGIIGAATGGLVVLAAAFIPLAKAFSAFMSLQDAQAKQGPKVAKAQEAAAKATANASKQVARARKSEADAEKEVDKARESARKHLEDLTDAQLAAARAADQANRSVLGAASKQAAVMADATSTAEDRLNATLALQDAEDNATDAASRKAKADKDLTDAQKKGIEGSDEVVAAQKRLADAHQATLDAQQSLNDTIANGNQSIADAAASTQDYDVAVAKLSASGLILLKTLQDIFAIMEPLGKLMQDAAFPGITEAVKAFGALFGTIKNGKFDPGPLIEPLKLVGQAISDVGTQFANLFKDPKFVKDLTRLLTIGATAIESLAGPLTDLIGGLVDGLANLGDNTGVVWKALGDGLSALGGALDAFFTALSDPETTKAMAQALGALMTILSNVITMFGPFLAEMTKIVGPFLEKLSGPLTTVFQSFLDIIVKFMSGGILDGFVNLMTAIGTALDSLVKSGVIDQLSGAFGKVLTTLADALPGIIDQLLPALVGPDGLIAQMPALVQGFVDLFVAIVPAIPDLITLVTEFTNLAIDILPLVIKVMPFVVAFFKGLMIIFIGVVTWVQNIITWFNNMLDTIGSVASDLAGIAKTMWDPLWNAFKGIINLIIGAWNSLDFSINITVPSWIPGIGGKGWKVDDIIPDIPKLAEGGIITRPSFVFAGEAGPEAIVPLSQFKSFANGLGDLVGRVGAPVTEVGTAQGGKTVNANFYGDIKDEADVDMILDKLSFASLRL